MKNPRAGLYQRGGLMYNKANMGAFFEGLLKWAKGWGIGMLLLVGVVLIYFTFTLFDVPSGRTFQFVFATLPIWLPIITFMLFFEMWLMYVRKYFDLNQGRTTLEIRLPQEVMKSPEAMELALSQIYQVASPDNHVQTYWDGKHPPVYGLEVVSRGGNVSFYINTPKKKFKNLVETQLYAQYPGIEINELEVDYTAEFPWNIEKYFYFSFHYKLKEPNPYPIKTYFDFGLHTMPKEEEKSDPITVMLDALGSIGPGESLWIQLLIQAHKKQNLKSGSLKAKPDWKDEVKEKIQDIIKAANKRAGTDSQSMMQLTDGEKNIIQAMERSLSKYAFVTNIRGMYLGKQDAVQPGERLGMLAGLFRQYDDVNRNQIGPIWRTDTDWPWWQDIGKKHTTAWKKAELMDYKKRVFNRRHHEADPDCLLTTEEIATIYHFPGKVALTPTLGRIPSARSEAPGNLPTG